VLFKTHDNFNPHKLCALARGILNRILWLFSPWP